MAKKNAVVIDPVEQIFEEGLGETVEQEEQVNVLEELGISNIEPVIEPTVIEEVISDVSVDEAPEATVIELNLAKIVKGQTTKAGMIRALADAGLTRAQVHKAMHLLGYTELTYQHVFNTLRVIPEASVVVPRGQLSDLIRQLSLEGLTNRQIADRIGRRPQQVHNVLHTPTKGKKVGI